MVDNVFNKLVQMAKFYKEMELAKLVDLVREQSQEYRVNAMEAVKISNVKLSRFLLQMDVNIVLLDFYLLEIEDHVKHYHHVGLDSTETNLEFVSLVLHIQFYQLMVQDVSKLYVEVIKERQLMVFVSHVTHAQNFLKMVYNVNK